MNRQPPPTQPPCPLPAPPESTVPAIGVVGFSNCGKTELICKLLDLARQRGLRVGALKHSHKTLDFDRPGKDTWRFREAGAQAVALAAPGLLLAAHFPAVDPDLSQALAALPPELDLVLVEGYKRGHLPKLVFVPPSSPPAALPDYERIIAYISDTALTTAVPVFSRDQAREILDFLLQWLPS